MDDPSDLKLVERLKNPPSCVYCHDSVSASDAAWRCPTCSTRHHEACAREHGRCAVFSCETPVPGGRARNRAQVTPPGAIEHWTFDALVLGMRAVRAVRALPPRAVGILMYSAGVCWCGWTIYRLIFSAWD